MDLVLYDRQCCKDGSFKDTLLGPSTPGGEGGGPYVSKLLFFALQVKHGTAFLILVPKQYYA
jgi:hypothetical protein